MKRVIARTAAVATMGVAAVVVAATPASAASSQCFVGTSRTCTTLIIPANRDGHFVDYAVNNRLRINSCNYLVRDVNSRVAVRWGTAPANTRISGSVYGLYGFYQLELWSCNPLATGILDNDR